MIGKKRHIIFVFNISIQIFLLLISSVLFAQNESGTTSFLREFITHSKQEIPFSKSLMFLDEQPQNLPLIQEIGFRTKTDEMELEKQEYIVRFKFSSFKERIAVKKNNSATRKKIEIRQNMYLLDQITDVYFELLDWKLNLDKLSFLESEKLIFVDKQKIFNQFILHQINFNMKDWIENEKDLLEIESEILKARQIIEYSNKIFNRTNLFKNTDWIDLSKIKNIVDNLGEIQNIHPAYLLQLGQNEIAKTELLIEEAEQKKWLDFAQFKYHANAKQPFQNEISFGAGIILPMRANNRLKMNAKILEIHRSEEKIAISKQNIEKKITNALFELQNLFSEHTLVNQFIKSQNLNQIFEKYQENQAIEPLELLQLKSTIFQYKKKKILIESEIYRTYIHVLSVSGKLTQYPIKNYFSKNLNLI